MVATFWGHSSAAGDYVQKSASREPHQQKKTAGFAAADDFRNFSQGEHMRVHPRKQNRSRHRTLPLHGTHDKSSQSIMKCYDDIHKDLHDGFMSPNDADALQENGERMMKDRNAV